MSRHHPIVDENQTAIECVCGWKPYSTTCSRFDTHRYTMRHVNREWAKEDNDARAEKERIRLLTQGQNWDLP